MTKQNKPSVLFVLSVDTEEEWDWQTEFPQHNAQVENIQAIQEFQQECNRIGIRPTYFVDYPVVNNPQSVDVLRSIDKTGQCEIGAHLHPWCNPPMTAENDDFSREWLSLTLSVKVVENVEEAITHIRVHSSGHSDGILTNDLMASTK